MTQPAASAPAFSLDAATYLTALAADNSKAFFDAHRDDYTRLIRQPLEDLLAAAEPTFGPGKVMRPNRDVRFSANKDPYRTDASMMAGEVGGVYANLNAERLDVGGGLYDPSRDQLERARTTIAERADRADELRQILDDLTENGFELVGPSLKTVPRGFDPHHPALPLLRLQHYAAVRHLPIDAPTNEILDTWARVRPLIGWIDEHVGPALARRH